MADLFTRRIKVRAASITSETDRLVKRAALAIDQAVVVGTPVDEGTARSNWLVALGAPDRRQIGAYVPGKALGQSESGNLEGALAQGRAVIAQRKEGQDVYISNNLPYIKELNDGTSAQAPPNFIEKAIMAASAVAKNFRILK